MHAISSIKPIFEKTKDVPTPILYLAKFGMLRQSKQVRDKIGLQTDI